MSYLDFSQSLSSGLDSFASQKKKQLKCLNCFLSILGQGVWCQELFSFLEKC